MTRSISSVLRGAASQKWVPISLEDAIPNCKLGNKAYWFARRCRGDHSMYELLNEERSAFLYLCSLIAEDEHG